MRIKEFGILLLVFTVLYALLWIVYDLVTKAKSNKELLNKAISSITNEKYIKFASFYGITATANSDIILTIFKKVKDSSFLTISSEAALYNISNIEYCIIIVYLEYLGLISGMKIQFDLDNIRKMNYMEEILLEKYKVFFDIKENYNDIISAVGGKADKDLAIIDKYYLVPGIRIINSIIYYVGDYI